MVFYWLGSISDVHVPRKAVPRTVKLERGLMVMEDGKCWLCLRITPSKILKVCHTLYNDSKFAHEAGLRATQLLRDAYLKDPARVSGKSSRVLIGGAIYLVGVLDLRFRKTQRDIALATNAVEPTIRKYSRLIAKTLGIPSRLDQWRELKESS